MIAVIDPALFLPRPPGQESLLVQELSRAIRICRVSGATLARIEDYWVPLWRELAAPLDASLRDPRAKRALGELRKRGREVWLPPVPRGETRLWGFKQLFEHPPLGEHWLHRMERTLLRAVLAREGVLLLVRRLPGRNLVRHRAKQHVVLDEVTRWVLRLVRPGLPPQQVRCVHRARNLTLPWTTRVDWRLPAETDGARYPFCPPARWNRRATQVWRSVAGAPAWVDALGNGWARPNVPKGRGYHWDVFIASTQVIEAVGFTPINVTAYGVPAGEGAPGSRHHVQTKQQGRLRGDPGWSCPG